MGTALLARAAGENPGVGKAFADAGFKGQVAIHGATLKIVEVIAGLGGAALLRQGRSGPR